MSHHAPIRTQTRPVNQLEWKTPQDPEIATDPVSRMVHGWHHAGLESQTFIFSMSIVLLLSLPPPSLPRYAPGAPFRLLVSVRYALGMPSGLGLSDSAGGPSPSLGSAESVKPLWPIGRPCQAVVLGVRGPKDIPDERGIAE